MACYRASHQEATEKTSAAKGHESTVSASMSDDVVGESPGMVAGSDVVPLAAEIIAVAGVPGGGVLAAGVGAGGVGAGGVVAMLAGPQMAPHSVVVAAAAVS